MEYITAVKQIIPGLVFLDGEAIQMNGIIPKQNFLCSLECYDFVEAFIIQFYRIYDSNQRMNLKGNLFLNCGTSILFYKKINIFSRNVSHKSHILNEFKLRAQHYNNNKFISYQQIHFNKSKYFKNE